MRIWIDSAAHGQRSVTGFRTIPIDLAPLPAWLNVHYSADRRGLLDPKKTQRIDAEGIAQFLIKAPSIQQHLALAFRIQPAQISKWADILICLITQKAKMAGDQLVKRRIRANEVACLLRNIINQVKQPYQEMIQPLHHHLHSLRRPIPGRTHQKQTPNMLCPPFFLDIPARDDPAVAVRNNPGLGARMALLPPLDSISKLSGRNPVILAPVIRECIGRQASGAAADRWIDRIPLFAQPVQQPPILFLLKERRRKHNLVNNPNRLQIIVWIAHLVKKGIQRLG